MNKKNKSLTILIHNTFTGEVKDNNKNTLTQTHSLKRTHKCEWIINPIFVYIIQLKWQNPDQQNIFLKKKN